MSLIDFMFCILCVVYGWIVGHLIGREPDWKAFSFQGVCVVLFMVLLYMTYKIGR